MLLLLCSRTVERPFIVPRSVPVVFPEEYGVNPSQGGVLVGPPVPGHQRREAVRGVRGAKVQWKKVVLAHLQSALKTVKTA